MAVMFKLKATSPKHEKYIHSLHTLKKMLNHKLLQIRQQHTKWIWTRKCTSEFRDMGDLIPKMFFKENKNDIFLKRRWFSCISFIFCSSFNIWSDHEILLKQCEPYQ